MPGAAVVTKHEFPSGAHDALLPGSAGRVRVVPWLMRVSTVAPLGGRSATWASVGP